MGLMNDYICEAGNDETLQEDLDYIASSEIPVEALRDSKVLVTGATGLIGVSLVRALLCVNRVRNLNLQVLALIRNKEKAMEVLKSKLYTILLEEKKSEVSDIRGVQVSNGFGSAKRSYVMQPYRLIKDNDSGYESSDVDGILDGNITDMLDYNLKNKKE